MINFCEVIEISNNLSFLLNFGTSRLLLPLSSLAETALDRHLNRKSILFSNFSLDFLLTIFLTLFILKSRPISISIPNSKKINISLSHCIVNKVTFFRYFPLSSVSFFFLRTNFRNETHQGNHGGFLDAFVPSWRNSGISSPLRKIKDSQQRNR